MSGFREAMDAVDHIRTPLTAGEKSAADFPGKGAA